MVKLYAIEGPKKACEYYDKTVDSVIGKFMDAENKLHRMIYDSAVYKTIEKFSPKHVTKILPYFRVEMDKN